MDKVIPVKSSSSLLLALENALESANCAADVPFDLTESESSTVYVDDLWKCLMLYTHALAKVHSSMLKSNTSLDENELFRIEKCNQRAILAAKIFVVQQRHVWRRYGSASEHLPEDVFLSHSGPQKDEYVSMLSEILKASFEGTSWEVFFDAKSLPERDRTFGSVEMRRVLLQCSVGVVVCSQSYLQRKWCLMEQLLFAARLARRHDVRHRVTTDKDSDLRDAYFQAYVYMFDEKARPGSEFVDEVLRMHLPWYPHLPVAQVKQARLQCDVAAVMVKRIRRRLSISPSRL